MKTEFLALIDTHKLSKLEILVGNLIVANKKELGNRVDIFFQIGENYRKVKKQKEYEDLVKEYKQKITNLINEL